MAKTDKTQDSPKHVLEHVEPGQNSVGGRIQMSEDVVATIAGLTAREVEGIHALGRSRLMAFGDSPTRGVAAEVGAKEAALDLEVIIEHGCDIRAISDEVRRKVAEQVEKMAGRKVVEINLDVVGVHIPGKEPEPEEPKGRPRVV